MKISILSFYSGMINRGTETWASFLQKNITGNYEIEIISGSKKEKINWQSKIKLYWIFLVFKNTVCTTLKWSNADVIVPTNGALQVLYCRLITLFLWKPMVVFGHSGLGADDKWNLLCSPNVFVAFSTYQKKWVERFKFPWTRVVLIPHAIDLKRFTPAVKKPKKNIVLCVAANTPDKRVVLVRKAVELIPGVEFMAVGKGNDTNVPFERMPEIYRKADIFCFVPQPWEAFGLVFLEAMASGLPVVTIDDPVRREIIGDAGVFVKNPEDSVELSKAITFALNKDWDNKPRLQAEKFSWDRIRIQYDELFKL